MKICAGESKSLSKVRQIFSESKKSVDTPESGAANTGKVFPNKGLHAIDLKQNKPAVPLLSSEPGGVDVGLLSIRTALRHPMLALPACCGSPSQLRLQLKQVSGYRELLPPQSSPHTILCLKSS